MYRVVGCSNCETLWIVEDEPDTTQCPRCRTRHQFRRLQPFVVTDSKAEARDVRSALLAARQDADGAAETLDSVADIEETLEDIGIEDDEFLAKHGLDAENIEAEAEAAIEGPSKKSRRERVLEAVRELEEPDESAIIAYATDRGVPEDYVQTVLAKLSRTGEITRTSDGYRLL